ncbi:MAG TPA: phosphoserine phosphatase SerB, partial [Bdellovibrionota bacterium]|nr:phosphoserine phosphatase SerB [Bdellovibrionota bacterium]
MNVTSQPDNPRGRLVLVTVSGPDAPGITAELTAILAQAQVTVLDLGQAVIHGLLSLSLLYDPGQTDEKSTVKDLLFKAAELGLKLDFQVIDKRKLGDQQAKEKFHYALTLIGDSLTARVLHEVTACLTKHDCNIDFIQRLSQDEFSCVELLVGSQDEVSKRKLGLELLQIARRNSVDIALQSDGLFRRSKRLVVMDMDSTLIQNEVIDEFARQLGVYEEVARITHEAMKGKLDFDQALQLRCEKLKGLTLKDVDDVYHRLELTQGAEDLCRVLKKLGYRLALISGGFQLIADRFRDRLGMDFAYANTLEFQGGVATGRVIPPIVNAQRKADLLQVIAQQERILLDQVIAVGDGANDLLMLEKAGLGIAFNAKPLVRE